MFGVAMVEEGARLREAGIMTPILLLGGVFERQASDVIALDLTPVVFTYAQAEAFSDAAVKAGRTLPVAWELGHGASAAHHIRPPGHHCSRT